MFVLSPWIRSTLVGVALLTSATAFAAPRRYAVVIGPSSDAAVVRNVKTVAETLDESGFRVVALCDDSAEFEPGKVKTLSPTKENLEKIFEKSGPLKLGRDSALVVYYIGAVAADSDGNAFFVLQDGELADAKAFRKAESQTPCNERAALFVDAWPAEEDENGFDPRTLVDEDGVPTAACREKSGASVFSYWLNAGVSGAADADSNGEIDAAELFAHMRERLEQSDGVGYAASQNVEPFALCQRPRREYWTTTDALADQIVTQARAWGKNEIVVEDFVEVDAAALKDRPELADALRSFAVDATARIRRCVETKQAGVATRGVGGRLVARPRVEARENENGEIEFAARCLVAVGKETAKAATFDAVVLAADSGETTESARATTDSGEAPDWTPEVRVEARASKDEPWREREIRRVDGRDWIELNPGETYRVVVETPRDVPEPGVCMRLLVDGCNSLPQYEAYVAPPTDVFGEKTASESANAWAPELVVAPAVRLDEARHWLLRAGKTDAYGGFYDAPLKNYREFKVVERSDGDDGENGELGTVVVAFYKGVRVRGGGDAQTVPGAKRPRSVSTVDGVKIGELIQYRRLRYASAKYLERLESGASFDEPTEIGVPLE